MGYAVELCLALCIAVPVVLSSTKTMSCQLLVRRFRLQKPAPGFICFDDEKETIPSRTRGSPTGETSLIFPISKYNRRAEHKQHQGVFLPPELDTSE